MKNVQILTISNTGNTYSILLDESHILAEKKVNWSVNILEVTTATFYILYSIADDCTCKFYLKIQYSAHR